MYGRVWRSEDNLRDVGSLLPQMPLPAEPITGPQISFVFLFITYSEKLFSPKFQREEVLIFVFVFAFLRQGLFSSQLV